ncbi:hypothetical protein Q9S36_23530 [Microbacterium sp. ARD31]|uniref:hypothetical protein n=1 Tax=Microbacterium sp. ARD31 TaxID=2962576 RepID=UPI0028810998|nr:hypothetical protein [Microbacterium sp. ARD31]MDT0183159.1 hypothetical protein [Microbacterium sp. ARD31]
MSMSVLPPLLLSRDRPSDVARLDRNGALHRVRAGVYVQAAAWSALAPWQRYRVRVQAVTATWSDPVLCLESAAAEIGLPVFGEPREIHLLSSNGRSWREGDVVVHGTRDERSVLARDGIRMTSVADTAVDLCRVLPPAFALAVADAALRMPAGEDAPAGSLDVAALGRGRSDRRGRRQLDWVGRRATAAAESTGESVSRAVIEWLGFEEPELQREHRHEGALDRTDFFWARTRTIGESDGYGKYDAADADASKAHFIEEKKREDRLRRHEGGFARWDWADAMRAEPLGGKLNAAGLSPVHRRRSAFLATLAANPRSFAPRTRGSRARPGAGPRVSA